jgi:tetratricopeptide (TPR) repeat protein
MISRGLAALREGRLADAEKITRELSSAAPNDAATHQLAAVVALQSGRYDEADSWARSSLALRPDHPPAMMIAGRAARAMGNAGQARDWFRRVRDLAPDKPEAFFQLGLAEIESADPTAPATLAALAERFPREADGWREIGAAFARLNRLEEAEAAFRRAANASADPGHAVNLGRILLARGSFAEAVAFLRKALAAAPDRLDILAPLAQALRQTGAPQEARRCLMRLVERQPDNSTAFYTLGLVCDDLRDWPAAIAAYGRCVALRPDMPEAQVNLGLALQQVGEMDAAIACYRAAMRLRADTFSRIVQALPSTQKGVLWLNTGRLRRALGA